MERSLDSNSNYLLEQLLTARKEINNLRQQIKSLRYVHERDVNSIKKLLGLCTNGAGPNFPEESLTPDALEGSLKDGEPSTSSKSNDDCALTCRPIGTISSWFPNKKGTPRQSVVCDSTPGKITLFKSTFTNPEHALQGLEEFSHMWILFHFHKNELGHIRAKVAPPRLNGIKTGVFSTRSPHRPCPIGLSLVKIIKIEDYTIYFEGVDMIDQTPVLDIKPYIPQYDNPSNFEKILQSTHAKGKPKNTSHVASSSSSANNLGNDWVTNDMDKTLSDNCNDNMCALNHKSVIYSKNIEDNQTLVHASSSSSSSTSSLIDVSRDEELALRLQAEEFQDNLNFENVYVSSNVGGNVLESSSGLASPITNVNPIGYDTANATEEVVVGESDVQSIVRNTRLLDGADGPTALCGTDSDLISRRATNLRLDDSSSSSSPIRMGVREAPDGEEGFDLSRAYNVQGSSNGNAVAAATGPADGNGPSASSQTSDVVRVPDWISKPKTSGLSVVFNERSLLQLGDIVNNDNDKAEEKKRAVENVLKEDPRSVYLRRRYGNQFYTFLIHDLHITCRFDDDKRLVTVFQIRHAGRTCECGQPEWQCSGHSPTPVFDQNQ